MNNENLYILIATIDNRASNLLTMLIDEQENVFYIITHQIINLLDEQTKEVISQIKQRKDVIYMPLLDVKGLAKNRNNSLAYVDNGIALISDDDVIFCNNFFQEIKRGFMINPEIDVITFKTLNLSGQDYRKYPNHMIEHNQRSITGIGSIEIAFRVNMVKKNNIKFDEHFGPGATEYPIGEDYIFMVDVLKKGLKAIFLPIAIVKHPDISTGLRFDQELIFGRGAVFARVFGMKSVVLDVIYSLKKYKLYKHEVNFFEYLYSMLRGSIHYLISKKDEKS